MSVSRSDTYRVQRDDAYLRELDAEAAFWDQPHIFDPDLDLPVLDPYINKRFTGDQRTGWFDTIAGYGDFRRGCSLGTASLKEEARILQANPGLHLTFYDISGESLAKHERRLGSQFPGRVAIEQIDLNFVELPESAFDVIVSAGCLHHLENLEHIAYQINRALTPSGCFFLYDYVGEARFQYPAEEKRFFEALIDDARTRHPILSAWRVAWSNLNDWSHSPFEAVHSDETLAVLPQYLDQHVLRFGGSIVWLLLWLKPVSDAPPPPLHGWPRLLARLRGAPAGGPPSLLDVLRDVAPDLLWLDSALTDARVFRPWDAFAVYRKKGQQ